MTSIHRNALVSHSADEMFALVDDVERYPEFLPWCQDARVLSRTEDEVRATLVLSRGGVQKSFSTLNRRQPGKMIELRLLEGPFRHLEGFWRFEALGEQASKISLDLDFEFKNRMIGLVVGPVFNPVADSLVDAFCKRADTLYGKA